MSGERAAQLLGKDKEALRVVTCHLGNGCSVAAVHGGRSVDTTMCFTPLDGVMMGTRCGSVDPGILTFLMRQGQLNADEIDGVLNHKSGLLGISDQQLRANRVTLTKRRARLVPFVDDSF